MLEKIRAQLARLSAHDVGVEQDENFELQAGTLVRVSNGGAYWHLPPMALLEMLNSMPDGAGSSAIKERIGRDESIVWHGPSPDGSRDLNP